MESRVELRFDDSGVLFGHIEVRPVLVDRIREAQKENSEFQNLIEKVKSSDVPGFSVDDSGVLWFGLRLCVPSSGGLREEIMTEGHNSVYSVHPGYIKMYRDL